MDTDSNADAVETERYHIDRSCSEDEFLAVAKVYAREVVSTHGLSVSVSDLEWELSKRAKRRAGALRYADGEPKAIVITWAYFLERGWTATTAIIRHELIHAHLVAERSEHRHTEAFEEWADRLDTSVHCELFTDPNWWVHCTGCDAKFARYRESKVVTDPGSYCCGTCGSPLRVEPVNE